MDDQKLSRRIRGSYRTIIVISTLVVIVAIGGFYFFSKPKEAIVKLDTEDPNRIENGIHVSTGFIDAPGMQETIQNCTSCHSAQLVIQNRMDTATWEATIDWMQQKQGLWDLGANEKIIISYLVKNYPPLKKGRREALKNIEWYSLNE